MCGESTAGWDGASLIIVTTYPKTGGCSSTARQTRYVLRLDANGELVVEMTVTRRAGDLPPVVTISRYRREPHQPETALPITDPDVYAVYRGIVTGSWLVRVAQARTVVIQQETPVSWPCALTYGHPDPEWQNAFDAFRAALTQRYLWRAGLDLGVPYRVVRRVEIDAAVGRGWAEFFRRYPDAGGFMRMSAVGFDSARTRAVLATDVSCGATCGEGGYRFLEKRSGAWQAAEGPGLVGPCGWFS
ncbi:MAG: hypothetical protein R2752_03045 [Vicinamibacterales bacterium]